MGVQGHALSLQATAHAQDLRIFAEQQGAVRDRQINEFLVVRVFAGTGCFGGILKQSGSIVKFIQDIIGVAAMGLQAVKQMGITQHAPQFFAHGCSGNPVQTALVQCGA
jgi:hypothetical protein